MLYLYPNTIIAEEILAVLSGIAIQSQTPGTGVQVGGIINYYPTCKTLQFLMILML